MKHPDDARRYREAYEARRSIAQHNTEATAQRQGVMYTVTTLNDGSSIGRTVAVVDEFALADAWLRSNAADLHETIYQIALIEEVYKNELYGGLVYGREQFWYAWEPNEHGFRPIETPECYRSSCGYGIG